MPVVVELNASLAEGSGVRRLETTLDAPQPVAQLLTGLAKADARLAPVLLDPDDGELDWGVMVVVNGAVVHRRDLSTHAVRDGDRVGLHPVLAGG